MKTENVWNPEFYDTKHNFVTNYGAPLVSLLNPKKGERILDLGCGTAVLTHEIAKTGAEVIGIDSSAAMIATAKKNYPEIQFQVEDGHNFHFDVPFDAVFSNAALHWMMQPQKVLQCVWQVLKKNGRFVFEFGGKGNVNHVLNAIDQAAAEFGRPNLPLVNYYPSLAEYATLLEAQGFRVVFAEHFDRPTKLEGEDGLKNWVKMFRNQILEQIPSEKQPVFLQRVEDIARPVLYHDGNWWADYVRLRAVATKTSSEK